MDVAVLDKISGLGARLCAVRPQVGCYRVSARNVQQAEQPVDVARAPVRYRCGLFGDCTSPLSMCPSSISTRLICITTAR